MKMAIEIKENQCKKSSENTQKSIILEHFEYSIPTEYKTAFEVIMKYTDVNSFSDWVKQELDNSLCFIHENIKGIF
jgi:hypothetical protein